MENTAKQEQEKYLKVRVHLVYQGHLRLQAAPTLLPLCGKQKTGQLHTSANIFMSMGIISALDSGTVLTK